MKTHAIAASLTLLVLLATPLALAHDCNNAGTVSYDRNHDQVCPSVLTICAPGHLCVSVRAAADDRLLVAGLLP